MRMDSVRPSRQTDIMSAESDARLPGEPVPFFQPIVSVSDGQIYGYEVLGRSLTEQGPVSLGSFFHDVRTSHEERLQIDRSIRRQALEKKKREGSPARLFLNIHPAWIYTRGADPFPTMQMVSELGLKPEEIIIEITEENLLSAEFSDVMRLIGRYREAGIRIAIDDFSYPNFDRLIAARPAIVKLDMQLVKKAARNLEYRRLTDYISRFAQELGVAVLFEGVEDVVELESGLEAGASLMQGFYFAAAGPEFLPPDRFEDDIRLALSNVYYRSVSHLSGVVRLERELNRYMRLLTEQPGEASDDLDAVLARIHGQLPSTCFRLFVCDETGKQLSANLTRVAGIFERQEHFRGNNWSWRPYFLDNLIRMREYEQGVISNPYIDHETRHRTITFSYPLRHDRFLFMDFLAASNSE